LIVAAKGTTIAAMDTTSNLSRCAERRHALQSRMGKGVAIIPTGAERIRNRDSDYLYRFDSYFYYLSGFPSPRRCSSSSPERNRGPFSSAAAQSGARAWEGIRNGPEGRGPRLVSTKAYPVGRSTSTCRSCSLISLRFISLPGRCSWDARIMDG